MSYRHTFITDFIYQSDNNNLELTKVFKEWIGSGLISKVDKRGYGFYAGMFKGLYDTEYQNDLKDIIPRLRKATKHSFRLIVLPEGKKEMIIKIDRQD
jgi:hypothetical protein